MIIECDVNKCKYCRIKECKKSNEYYCYYNKHPFRITTISFNGKKRNSAKAKFIDFGDVKTYSSCPLFEKCYSKGDFTDLKYMREMRTMYSNKTKFNKYLKPENRDLLEKFLAGVDLPNFVYSFDKNGNRLIIKCPNRTFYYELHGSFWYNDKTHDIYRHTNPIKYVEYIIERGFYE